MEEQQRRKSKRSRKEIEPASSSEPTAAIESDELEDETAAQVEVAEVRVYDYDAMKQEFEVW